MILGSPCWLGDFIGTASFGGPKGKRDSFFLLSIPFLVILGSLILTQGIVCLQVSKSSSLGGQQILDCELNFPNGILVAYTITWTKDGLKKPVLFNYYGYAPQIHENFAGRVRLVNGISLEISHIREEDEGWYECKVLYLDGIENNKKNGTWIYLNVNDFYFKVKKNY